MTPWDKGGWGVVIDEYPDEGVMGPFATEQEAEQGAVEQLGDDETTVVPLSPEQCRDLAGVCEECGGPADFEDADRVQCDCGTTVCSACCVAVGGESYCPDCARERGADIGPSRDRGDP